MSEIASEAMETEFGTVAGWTADERSGGADDRADDQPGDDAGKVRGEVER